MPSGKFDKILSEAVNNGAVASKVIRYIIFLGWIVAATFLLQAVNNQGVMQATLRQIEIQMAKADQWRANMDKCHFDIDKRLDRLEHGKEK